MKLDIKTGSVYGQLTVISEGEKKIIPSGQKLRTIKCCCDCGNVKDVLLVHLSRGRIDNCGCKRRVRQGLSFTKLYRILKAMCERCDGKTKNKKRYKDRGITVCDEWKNDFRLFINWAKSNGYKEGLQIDRIDNNLGYYPENCRWVTPEVNCNNREITFNVLYNGQVKPFKMLIRELNREYNQDAIRTRIKRGWTAQKAFDTPIRKGNYFRSLKPKNYNTI